MAYVCPRRTQSVAIVLRVANVRQVLIALGADIRKPSSNVKRKASISQQPISNNDVRWVGWSGVQALWHESTEALNQSSNAAVCIERKRKIG